MLNQESVFNAWELADEQCKIVSADLERAWGKIAELQPYASRHKDELTEAWSEVHRLQRARREAFRVRSDLEKLFADVCETLTFTAIEL